MVFVGNCGTIPTVANSTNNHLVQNLSTFSIGTTIVYTCITGYEFSTEESSTLNVTCQGDNSWSTYTDCERKCFIN